MDDVLSAAGAFGVEVNENSKFELGALTKMFYQRGLTETIDFETSLGLFLNYLDDDFGNMDVDWRVLLSAALTDFLNVSIGTHLLYDHDTKISEYDDNGMLLGVGPRTQFKEVLSIGMAFKF